MHWTPLILCELAAGEAVSLSHGFPHSRFVWHGLQFPSGVASAALLLLAICSGAERKLESIPISCSASLASVRRAKEQVFRSCEPWILCGIAGVESSNLGASHAGATLDALHAE